MEQYRQELHSTVETLPFLCWNIGYVAHPCSYLAVDSMLTKMIGFSALAGGLSSHIFRRQSSSLERLVVQARRNAMKSAFFTLQDRKEEDEVKDNVRVALRIHFEDLSLLLSSPFLAKMQVCLDLPIPRDDATVVRVFSITYFKASQQP